MKRGKTKRLFQLGTLFLIGSLLGYSVQFFNPVAAAAPSSLQFDGTNDIARFTNLPLSSQFTYEAWVKRTADTGLFQTFASDANSSYAQAMFTLYVDGGNADCGSSPPDQFAYYQISGDAVQCSGVTADIGTWHHVAVARDTSGTRRFFVDGILRNTQSNTGAPTDSNGTLTFGRAGDYNGEYFSGLVDEVRISNISRYPVDFIPPTTIFSTDSNTVGLWHSDEGSGQTVNDNSGNGRVGVLGTSTASEASDPIWTSDSPIGSNGPTPTPSLTPSPSPSPSPSPRATPSPTPSVSPTPTPTPTVTPSPTADPAQVGQWQSPISWPLAPIHLVHQPDGRILMWDEEDGGMSARLWQPTTGVFTAVPNTTSNLFCAGHSALNDGRTLVSGGHAGSNFFGIVDANIFDVTTQSWTRVADMNFARWYPTSTTLTDGRILATSGWINPSQLANVPEIYNAATNTWTQLPGAQRDIAMYSFMFQLPNGSVFDAGPGVINGSGSTMTYTLNTSTQTWSGVGNSFITGHSAVMYEPGKVMKSGQLGDPDFPLPTVHARTVVVDMNQPTPLWREVAPMSFPRSYHNLVLLPDGNVLAVGGGRTTNGQDPQNAVLDAELWSPVTETWTTMARQQRPRLYHSGALLLPDGRVVSAGGYFPAYVERDAEIYSPPYLFRGPRPTIVSAPASATYGSNFFVETADTVAQVSLVRLGAPTHGFDQDQRLIELNFAPTSGGLTVSAPANSNLAQPGFYMLFILNANGVPSIARFVRLDLNPAPTPTPTPSPSVSPTPTPSLLPSPSPIPTPSPTPTPTPTPEPTPSPSPPPTPTPSPSTSRSLQFDGTNDIVRITTGGNIPLSTQFTYEAWVRRTADLNGYQTFMSDATNTYSQAMFTLYIDNNNSDCPAGVQDEFAYYQRNGNQIQCSGVAASLNVWYHVAVTRDASGTRRMFIDGILRNTQTSSLVPTDSSGTLTFGRAGSFNGEYFGGRVDEVRISNIARYTSSFTPPNINLETDANTIGLWHADEGTGQILGDSSANGRNGTLGSSSGTDSADPTWNSDTPLQ